MLGVVGSHGGSQGTGATQLFWSRSCHWPPGNAATTGSSSKANVSWLSLRTDQVCSCYSLGIWDAPWGILGNDPPRFLRLHFCAGIPRSLSKDSDAFWRQLRRPCLLPLCGGKP